MAQYMRSAQTKEAIIETACRLFYEKGYTGATVRQICAQSGLSVSRVNYHFSSKADLAGVVCSQFFHNFTGQLRHVMGGYTSYSVVNEAIALRFLVRLLLADPEREPSARFYREVAREGILEDVFSVVDRRIFSEEAKATAMLESPLKSGQLVVYSRIFASALPAVIQSWDQVLQSCGGDRDQAMWLLQDVFVGLFMQMLDYEHHIQKGILELSRAYYNLMDIEIRHLTDVHIHLNGKLSQQEKGRLAPFWQTLAQLEQNRKSDKL